MAHPQITCPALMEAKSLFSKIGQEQKSLQPRHMITGRKEAQLKGEEKDLYRELNDLYDNQILSEPMITRLLPLKQSPDAENVNVLSEDLAGSVVLRKDSRDHRKG